MLSVGSDGPDLRTQIDNFLRGAEVFGDPMNYRDWANEVIYEFLADCRHPQHLYLRSEPCSLRPCLGKAQSPTYQAFVDFRIGGDPRMMPGS